GFAATDRAEQVENLLALFETLRGILEVADDPLNRLFHAEEIFERRIDLDGAVEEDAAESRVGAGVDDLGLTDGGDQALSRGGVHHGVVTTAAQVIVQTDLFALLAVVDLGKQIEYVFGYHFLS